MFYSILKKKFRKLALNLQYFLTPGANICKINKIRNLCTQDKNWIWIFEFWNNTDSKTILVQNIKLFMALYFFLESKVNVNQKWSELEVSNRLWNPVSSRTVPRAMRWTIMSPKSTIPRWTTASVVVAPTEWVSWAMSNQDPMDCLPSQIFICPKVFQVSWKRELLPGTRKINPVR